MQGAAFLLDVMRCGSILLPCFYLHFIIPMRFTLMFLLALGLSGLANAQLLAIELAGGPTMAYRILTGEKEYKDWFDDERPIFSYEGGLRLVYQVNEQWSMGSGLTYSRKGYDWKALVTDIYGFPTREISPNHVSSFIELPFFARYIFKENKSVKLYAHSGFAANFLLRERLQMLDSSNGKLYYYTFKESVARSFNIGLLLGIGGSFRLSESWYLGLEPTVNSQLLPFLPSKQKDIHIFRRLFSAGIHVVVGRKK